MEKLGVKWMRADAAPPAIGRSSVIAAINPRENTNEVGRRVFNSAAPCLLAHRRGALVDSPAGNSGSERVRSNRRAARRSAAGRAVPVAPAAGTDAQP